MLLLGTWLVGEGDYPPAVMFWWEGSLATNLSWKQFVFGMKNTLISKMVAQGFPRPECVRRLNLKKNTNTNYLLSLVDNRSRAQRA